MSEGVWARWSERLAEPVDASSVLFLRIAFGVLMAWDFAESLWSGRLDRFYIAPAFHFKFPGFDGVGVLPAAGLWALFLGMIALASAVAAGYAQRVTAPLFALGYAYVFFLDQAAWNNHNYLILLVALLLATTPLERGTATVPRWTLWLFRCQFAVPYVFGGINKLNSDWLIRGQPMKLWLAEGTDGSLPVQTTAPWATYFFTWGGMLFDLAVVPFLLWRRTRWWAFGAMVAFHLANSQIFVIGVFPWLMIAASTIFLDPDWPLRLRRTVGKKVVRRPAPTLRRLSPVLAIGLAAWLAFQVLVPLRHWLIPGWVDWTEEGSLYAWRMKLRDKRGELTFTLRDPLTGASRPLDDAEALLTPRQRQMMLHNPEMIRQYSHFLADQLAGKLGRRFAVHVDARISLNGRPRQQLIAPEVDLGSAPRRTPAPWIRPLEPWPTP